MPLTLPLQRQQAPARLGDEDSTCRQVVLQLANSFFQFPRGSRLACPREALDRRAARSASGKECSSRVCSACKHEPVTSWKSAAIHVSGLYMLSLSVCGSPLRDTTPQGFSATVEKRPAASYSETAIAGVSPDLLATSCQRSLLSNTPQLTLFRPADRCSWLQRGRRLPCF